MDIINLALKTSNALGVGQTADQEDVNDCFILLNAMMGQWSRRRWLVYNLIDVSCASNGANTYSVGGGGDFSTPRTNKVEAAYIRLLPVLNTGSVDFPLEIIDSHEDYSRITMKALQSFPYAIFYDSGFPFGTLSVYPVPPAGKYEIHLILKNTLSQFATQADTINLPAEYTDALIWNLACRIRPLFGIGPDQTLVELALTSLNTIRTSNTQMSRMRMPIGIPTGGAGRWSGHGIPGFATTS